MVARTVARCSWVWTLSVLACAEAASLDPGGLAVQQSGKENAVSLDADTDDWVVFRLVDEDGRPVAGAKVSRDVALDNPRLAGRQLDWSEGVVSDANGRVSMPMSRIFTWWADKTTPYILHEERGIGAAPQLANESAGVRPPIVLTPVCRVHGVFSTENVPSSIPLMWVYIIVRGGDTDNWMLEGSFRADEEQDFEVLLPPGKYAISAAAIEYAGPKGSYVSGRIRHEKREIVVASGQQNLELGVINFRPTKAWSLIGQPAAEIGPMKEWKNSPPVTLADLRGRLVWLHFGGDKPFVAGSPAWLADVHNTLADKGLAIIGIYSCASMQELDREWEQAYRRQGGVPQVPFRIAIDGEGPASGGASNERRPGVTYERYDADGAFGGGMDVLIDPAGTVIEIPDTNNLKAALSDMLGLPAEEPDPARFRGLYRLEDGQILRRIAPPLIPERREFIRAELARKNPYNAYATVPGRAVFGWNGELRYTCEFRPCPTDLESILDTVIGLQKDEYDGPQELRYLELPGDWIVRRGSSLEARLLALERIILQELGLRSPIRETHGAARHGHRDRHAPSQWRIPCRSSVFE